MRGKPAERKMIRDIVQKIVAGYAPQKVILFGSYAYGHPDQDSDIDLLIVKDTDERAIDRWMSVKRLVRDPRRDVAVSPLVLTSHELNQRVAIKDRFIEEIMSRGEVLYG